MRLKKIKKRYRIANWYLFDGLMDSLSFEEAMTSLHRWDIGYRWSILIKVERWDLPKLRTALKMNKFKFKLLHEFNNKAIEVQLKNGLKALVMDERKTSYVKIKGLKHQKASKYTFAPNHYYIKEVE